MKRYQCFVFDLDGTLMDTSEGVYKSVAHTLRHMDFPVPEANFMHHFIGPPIYESFQKYCGMDTQQSAVATELFRELYKEQYLLEAEPYPGIYSLLRLLRTRGVKTAVATNKRIDYTLELLKHYSFFDLFDRIEGSDFSNRLTKTDIIRNSLAGLDVLPETAVMVGDTSSDCIGASHCGTDFFAVTYGFGYRSKEEAVKCGAIDAFDSVQALEDCCRETF